MKLINQNIYIDGIDKKILRALMKDARTPVLEIARSVGVSGAAIHQRLRKLEKSGLISGSKFISLLFIELLLLFEEISSI